MWTIDGCGPLRVQRHPTGGSSRTVELRPKERAVVAALALDHPAPVHIDLIVERIWGASAPATAVISIRNHVTRIRRVEPDLVITEGSGYRLHPDVVLRFDLGRSGDVLPDLADAPEVGVRRRAIRERLAAQVDRDLERAVRDGPGPELVERLRLAVEDEPYREERWGLLARTQAVTGQRRDALLTLQQAREHLSEVGLEPGDALLRIERSILDGDRAGDTSEEDSAAAHPAPTVSVHPHRDEPFVGRTDALVALQSVWTATTATNRPHVVIVTGAAGSGKTRLVDRFLDLIDPTATPRVLWGRHRAGAGRAHGAIAESLRRVFDDEPVLLSNDRLAGLRRLVAAEPPDHAHTTDETAGDIAFARTQLGRELTRAVGLIGRRPTIWLLDDVQWADADTLALLEESIDGTAGTVLVIATVRQGSPAANAIAATFSRIAPVVTLQLEALDPTEVAELVRSVPGVDVSDAQVGALHERTGGLALYASEIVREMRRTGATELGAVPPAIRGWIEHRMGQLEPAVADTFRVAAVLDDVELDVLAEAAELTIDVAAARCDELIAVGLLNVDRQTGHVDFAHDLTREVARDSIGVLQRIEVERRVAEIVLAAHPTDHDRLAIHLHRSRDPRAVGHAILAGDQAIAVGAWDHARAMYDIALAQATDGSQRATALVGAGRTMLVTGDAAGARSALNEAIVVARSADAPGPHARAALALVGRAGRGAIQDDEDAQAEVLRSALDHLRAHTASDELTALRSDVQRELAIVLLLADAEAERSELLRTAFADAGRLQPPNPRALARATLGMRYALLGPDDLERRIEMALDVIDAASDLDLETRVSAWLYLHEDLRRAGRHDHAVDALAQVDLLLDNAPHPYWAWAARTWWAIGAVLDGDLDRAERIAADAFAMRPGVTEAAACYAVNLVDIRLYQGRADEMVGALRHAVEANPRIPTYRAVLALCAAEAGDAPLAAASLRWFTDRGCENLPADTNRFLGLAVLAHTAATLGDADAGRTLLPLLAPYDGQWVLLAAYGGGGATWGPASHALARLARLTGDGARAERWFDEAHRQASGRPLLLARIDADRRSCATPRSA